MAHEIARRLVHASGAIVPGLYLVDAITWQQVEYVLAAGIVIAGGLEIARLAFGFEWIVFETLTREYEADNVAGYALYTFSGALTGILVERHVAIPAILMLTLADPISGLLGSDELRTVKRPHVLLTMLLVCTGLAFVWVPLSAALLGGFAAMLADGIKPVVRGYVVDDNLTIPLVAAGGMLAGIALLPPVAHPLL